MLLESYWQCLKLETFLIRISDHCITHDWWLKMCSKTQGVDKITRTPHSKVQPNTITAQNTSEITWNISDTAFVKMLFDKCGIFCLVIWNYSVPCGCFCYWVHPMCTEHKMLHLPVHHIVGFLQGCTFTTALPGRTSCFWLIVIPVHQKSHIWPEL